MQITDPDAVREAFANPGLIPPPAEPGAAFWLRSRVARFSAGAKHRHLRALAMAEIGRIDPEHAARQAAARIRSGDSVRRAVIGAFGLVPDKALDLVLQVTPAYFDPSHSAADEPLRELVELLGPDDPEVIAARIGVLVQACDATAALAENGLRPPARTTKRLAADGTLITLDLTGHPFGAPPRECPGEALAIAIATAIAEELRS